MPVASPPHPGMAARRLARALLDLVLPPRCIACGVEIAEPHALCGGCWPKLEFIAAPMCRRCGVPLPHDPGPEASCAPCLARPPRYDRARAVLQYGPASRGMILRFKHGDRTGYSVAFAAWMERAGGELLAAADVLAPVPLHYRRLVWRRYNQAALLAVELGRRTGRPVAVDLLRRTRPTASQAGLGGRDRRRNLAGAIAVNPRRESQLQGRRVLLIDDVLTTGATVAACTRALLRAGAGAVDVLAVARTVRAQPIDS